MRCVIHGGSEGGVVVDEGYVKVQQALSFLVTDTTPAGIAQA
ncbi:hypothetical protein [Cryobacterium fucosi]|nr:hypothetical protein [Cryobacterium fucosi]